MDSRFKKFFEQRGVRDDVRDARQYAPFTTVNREPIRAEYSDKQRAFMLRCARQSDGFLIPRYAIEGFGLEKAHAEFKAYEDVYTGPPTYHIHPYGELTHTPVYPKSGKPLPTKLIYDASKNKSIELHIASMNGPHKGVNREDVHAEWEPAKYIIPPNPWILVEWFHHHDKIRDPEKRARHIERYHGGLDVKGYHGGFNAPGKPHVTKRKSREGDGKRLDAHPWCQGNFRDARRVWFVLEGVPKSDAILSYELTHGVPRSEIAVFNCLSVTLWEAPELRQFASRDLQGKPVYIVIDADGRENPNVLTQALFCRSYLRKLGVDAHIVAPPLELYEKRGIKGIDDYLAAGGNLDDLEVIEREAPVWLPIWLDSQGIELRRDRVKRDAEILEGLILHSGADGTFGLPLQTLARIMGVHISRVARAVKSLAEYGAIRIDGDLAVRRDWFSKQLKWEKDGPIITIRTELRAKTTIKPLADFENEGDSMNAATAEMIREAVREGVREGILDVRANDIIDRDGHPADEAERILAEEDSEA